MPLGSGIVQLCFVPSLPWATLAMPALHHWVYVPSNSSRHASMWFTRLLLEWVPQREYRTSVRMDLRNGNPRNKAISPKGLLNKACFAQNSSFTCFGHFSVKTAQNSEYRPFLRSEWRKECSRRRGVRRCCPFYRFYAKTVIYCKTGYSAKTDRFVKIDACESRPCGHLLRDIGHGIKAKR